MKVTLAKNWPAIRQVAYSLAAAALAVAAMLGYLTDTEVALWLERIGQWLGFAGLIIAGLYVKRGTPAPEPEPETNYEITYTSLIDPTSATAVIERVRAEAAAGIDQFGDSVRAELERRLER